MITIHNNNYDITAAEMQMTSKSNSVEYINSDYEHFAWAIFVNIYITQSIFLCNWKLILSNTYSYAQFWNCYTVAHICKNIETLNLLSAWTSAQAAQSSSIIIKANKYLKNLILSCLVIFVYLFIYMFLVRSAFSSISHSISTRCCIAARSASSSIPHSILY